MSKKRIIISIIGLMLVVSGGVWWLSQRSVMSTPVNNFISYKDRGLTAEEKAIYQNKIVELQEQLKSAKDGNDIFKLNMQIGIQHYALGEYALAQERYTTASNILPDNPTVWSELYIVENERGDYASAKAHIQKAIELNPASAQYWRWLIDLEKDRFSPSPITMQGLFSQAREKTSDSVEILALEARYLESINSFKSAIDVWKRLKEVNPSAAETYDQEITALQAKVQ